MPRSRWPRGLWRALALLGAMSATACAGASPVPAAVVSQRSVTAEQVLAILRRRHVDGTLPDARLSERAFDALLRALDPGSACAAARPQLLARRAHALPSLRAGDVGFVRALAAACGQDALNDEAASALALDALAKAFDPHSAFVDERRLAAEQAQIHAPLPEAQQARGRLIEQQGTRIAFVVLPSFYLQGSGRGATRDVRFLADALARQGAALLLLDLRGNRGGVIEEAVRLLAALGCEGDIARVQRAAGAVELLRAPADAGAYRGPLALLIDAGSAGVSELFAGAIQDRGRGALIGAVSARHGSAQTLVLLSSPKGQGRGAVRVTDRRFLRLAGSPIEGRGIAPDVALKAASAPGTLDDEAIARVREAEQLLER